MGWSNKKWYLAFVVLLIVLIMYCKTTKFCTKNCTRLESDFGSKGWVDPKMYEFEIRTLLRHRPAILKELNVILETNNWSTWGDRYHRTPQFTSMTHEDIKDSLHKQTSLSNTQSWKLFGLILNREVLSTAAHCPRTMAVLRRFEDDIVNAGFSCLEAGATTKRHRDIDATFYRCHIPLIVPEGDCYLEVEGVKRKWKQPLVFDDTMYHNAWNNTEKDRIILIVDFKRR